MARGISRQTPPDGRNNSSLLGAGSGCAGKSPRHPPWARLMAPPKMTEKHILKWVKSGVLDDTLWVSLGFASKLERLDRLHVVCAMTHDEQEAKLRMDTIYLERFDQAYSCYHGARRIDVEPDGVRVTLNAHGRKALDFREQLYFVLPKGLRGWKAAQRVFARMPKYKCGEVIEIAKLQPLTNDLGSPWPRPTGKR